MDPVRDPDAGWSGRPESLPGAAPRLRRDSGIPVGYGALVVVYLILAVVVMAMLRRLARVPLLPQMAGPGQRAGLMSAAASGS